MSLRWMPLACLVLGVELDAGEIEDEARGLAVRLETLEGETAVNGMAMAVTRAVGSGVPTLAERLIARWQRESGDQWVRTSSCCGWRFASRLQSGDSEVIQWRGSGGAAELLWSSLPMGQPRRGAPAISVPLPPDCHWSTTAHGEVGASRFVQRAARCPQDAALSLESMRRSLATHGWSWRRSGPLMLQAQRGSAQAQIFAAPASKSTDAGADFRSSLVVLETRAIGRQRP